MAMEGIYEFFAKIKATSVDKEFPERFAFEAMVDLDMLEKRS